AAARSSEDASGWNPAGTADARIQGTHPPTQTGFAGSRAATERTAMQSTSMQNDRHGATLPASAPDSSLCRRATELVADLSPPFLFNHCVRTFLFGEALGNQDGLKYDRELLYLSALLHDLGLTDSIARGGQRFEVEGADRARAFVAEHGLPEDKADIV